jgi:hypothetical protein
MKTLVKKNNNQISWKKPLGVMPNFDQLFIHFFQRDSLSAVETKHPPPFPLVDWLIIGSS